jgi:nucleotide-binding universal stress UspA family protein
VYKRILVEVDGTAAAHRALREAVDLAADQDAELEILHVVDLTPYGVPELGVPVRVYEETCQAQGRVVLSAATEYARQAGVETRAAMRQASGRRLSAAIVDEVRLFGADLVVLGTRGHRGLARWLLGDIAERVIRGSHVPVLQVQAK